MKEQKKASNLIIFNTFNQKILLLFKKSIQNWEIPGGGCEGNETFEKCLKREILEEINIKLDSDYKEYITIKQPNKIRKIYLKIISKPFEPKISQEHSNYTWVSFDELNSLKNDKKLKYYFYLLNFEQLKKDIFDNNFLSKAS